MDTPLINVSLSISIFVVACLYFVDAKCANATSGGVAFAVVVYHHPSFDLVSIVALIISFCAVASSVRRMLSDRNWDKAVKSHAVLPEERAGEYCVWMGHDPNKK
ncbi:hypothetical protein ASD15_14355 [Massilia sp. Root351]|uniref:hypothetical protein n=1 Tax=Massilia sp. Root351 TaxID=1736522 RepID=UPI0007103832|nr:hypothetical protein [Massilia sp. Root351]KQV81057.1 hypothetical protein ASD15_14355 [Massilia sp. Root351]